jgi:hypothetical protein
MALFINIAVILNTINMYRNNHCVSPVMWDFDIQNTSQNWADELAKRNLFFHSSNSYGENLAEMWDKPGTDKTFAVIKSIDAWYNEFNLYNYSMPQYGGKAGHFTQLVWASSQKIGVGISFNPKGSLVVVMEFFPAGNINIPIYFTKNVLPLCNNIYYPPSPNPHSPNPHSPNPPSPNPPFPNPPSPNPPFPNPPSPNPPFPNPPSPNPHFPNPPFPNPF